MKDILGGDHWLTVWNFIGRFEEAMNINEITEQMKENLLLHIIYIVKVKKKNFIYFFLKKKFSVILLLLNNFLMF